MLGCKTSSRHFVATSACFKLAWLAGFETSQLASWFRNQPAKLIYFFLYILGTSVFAFHLCRSVFFKKKCFHAPKVHRYCTLEYFFSLKNTPSMYGSQDRSTILELGNNFRKPHDAETRSWYSSVVPLASRIWELLLPHGTSSSQIMLLSGTIK